MQMYEYTIIVRSDLDGQSRDELIQRIVGMIPLPEGSEEPKVEIWGRRQLAYPIEKHTEGYYVYIETAMEGSEIAEMERNITYIEEVLRHLGVRKEG